jgi:hypothetical protein
MMKLATSYMRKGKVYLSVQQQNQHHNNFAVYLTKRSYLSGGTCNDYKPTLGEYKSGNTAFQGIAPPPVTISKVRRGKGKGGTKSTQVPAKQKDSDGDLEVPGTLILGVNMAHKELSHVQMKLQQKVVDFLAQCGFAHTKIPTIMKEGDAFLFEKNCI